MEKYYTHYQNWECYQNGMYRETDKDTFKEHVKLSIDCLRDPENAMTNVINEWTQSSKENLSDKKSNRKSWLGQAGCCYQYGCTEDATRKAWGLLTNEERINANEIASKVIELWERNY